MTRAEFRTLVKEFLAFGAQPYPASDAEYNTAIARGLEEFSELSLCLYSDNNDINTATGWLYGTPPLYDLTDAGFFNLDSQGYQRRVFLPTSVVVADRPLRDLGGRVGAVSYDTLQQVDVYASTEAAAAADVRYWSVGPERNLRLFPKPAAATFNSGGVKTGIVVGWYWHPVLTNETHVMYLPPSDLEPAAAFCAARILEPRSQGASIVKMRELDARAVTHMTARAAESLATVRGLPHAAFAGLRARAMVEGAA